MSKKTFPIVELTLDKIVSGGQTLGTLDDGRKAFIWGALPGEVVRAQVTKKKSSYVEGVVTEVLTPSSDRVAPKDPESYISTSPWQIMALATENTHKSALIHDAFRLHSMELPSTTEVYSDGVEYGYRNKVEFSFWYDTDLDTLSLAFFRRGSHGKLAVEGTSLASPAISETAQRVLKVLNEQNIEGRALKTLLIRSSQSGATAWQLYVKDEDFPAEQVLSALPSDENGEVIYSNPKSPASVITRRLTKPGRPLSDTLFDIPFHYATEGFFQINLPVYEEALRDMQAWIPQGSKVVDMYSGVGTIGLTIGGDDVTLVEVNEHAVREMERNVTELGKNAHPVLAASEQALEYIVEGKTIIVDPPRAGLHEAVIERLLDQKPKRIIYLSCNPVTQARDVALLASKYTISMHRGYNFFPHTPHIEHLVVLDLS